MTGGSIARRYARAFIALGQENGKTDTFAGDLGTFAAVLDTGDGELRRALTNPGLTTVERKAVLDQVLAKVKLDSDSGNFLRLLVDKNRIGAFDGIQRAFNEMAENCRSGPRSGHHSSRAHRRDEEDGKNRARIEHGKDRRN